MKEILKETKSHIIQTFPPSEERSKIVSNFQGLIDYLVKRQEKEKRIESRNELNIQEEILERLCKIEKRLEHQPSFSSIFNELEETSAQNNNIQMNININDNSAT